MKLTRALGTRRQTKKKTNKLVCINLLRLVRHSGNFTEIFSAILNNKFSTSFHCKTSVESHLNAFGRQNFSMRVLLNFCFKGSMTGQKNRALLVPFVVPYKALGNFPKPFYATKGRCLQCKIFPFCHTCIRKSSVSKLFKMIHVLFPSFDEGFFIKYW